MIGLCMIVKNESAIIRDQLLKLRDQVGILDFYAISDTGSTDNTVELIEHTMMELGIRGQVFRDAWHDFAYNRTLAMHHARMYAKKHRSKATYVWMLDADDSVSGAIDNVHEWEMDMVSVPLEFAQGNVVVQGRPQFFKMNRLADIVYVGFLHEVACVAKTNARIVKEKADGYYVHVKTENDTLEWRGPLEFPKNDFSKSYIARAFGNARDHSCMQHIKSLSWTYHIASNGARSKDPARHRTDAALLEQCIKYYPHDYRYWDYWVGTQVHLDISKVPPALDFLKRHDPTLYQKSAMVYHTARLNRKMIDEVQFIHEVCELIRANPSTNSMITYEPLLQCLLSEGYYYLVHHVAHAFEQVAEQDKTIVRSLTYSDSFRNTIRDTQMRMHLVMGNYRAAAKYCASDEDRAIVKQYRDIHRVVCRSAHRYTVYASSSEFDSAAIATIRAVAHQFKCDFKCVKKRPTRDVCEIPYSTFVEPDTVLQINCARIVVRA